MIWLRVAAVSLTAAFGSLTTCAPPSAPPPSPTCVPNGPNPCSAPPTTAPTCVPNGPNPCLLVEVP